MRRPAALAALALAATAIAGCGSSSAAPAVTQAAATQATATSSAATSSTIGKAQAARAYLAAVAPFKAADRTFAAEWKRAPDSASAATLAKIGAPLAQALTNMRQGLLQVAGSYPPAAADIKALVTASAPVIGDLDNEGTQTGLSVIAWDQQVVSDTNAMAAAAAIVRSDLGLPAKTS
jgi:hypothetical protein